jgi:hypothetical protein
MNISKMECNRQTKFKKLLNDVTIQAIRDARAGIDAENITLEQLKEETSQRLVIDKL